MPEDQDRAEAKESTAAPASARVTTHALRRVYAWRNEPKAEAPLHADLSAALARLPERERTGEAEWTIRIALSSYLGLAHLERRPGPDVLAPHLRAVAAATRSLRRLLHAQPDPPSGAPVPDALVEELTIHRGMPQLFRGRSDDGREVDQVEQLRLLLELTQQAAEAAAEINEAQAEVAPVSKRTGRPRDRRLARLVEDLEPLWRLLRAGEREAFLRDVLAAVGETATPGSLRGQAERLRQRRRSTPSPQKIT